MDETPKRRLLPSILLFAFTFLGFIALSVFLATERILEVELVLAVMFTLMGAIALWFELRNHSLFWRLVTALMALLVVICLAVFLAVRVHLHPALVLAGLFPTIGVLLYVTFDRRNAARAPRVTWEKLGEGRRDEPSPAERDVPVTHERY
jgi:hypothetical protein